MFNYAEMTTAELIELLFKEEDRVTLEHIQAVIQRGDEAKPRLLEILLNEDYWYEGQHGDFWISLHATVALCSMRDPQLLPDVLSMVLHAYFSEHEWVTDRWPELLAQFGEPAVEPLINFILEHRGAHLDNVDYSFARAQATLALTRIALEAPNARPRVLNFLCELFADAEENDRVFLSQTVICPAAIDRKVGREAIDALFKRRAITESVYGKRSEVLEYLSDRRANPADEFKDDLFDFYDPEAILVRQERWESKDTVQIGDEAYNRAYIGPPPFPLPFERLYSKTEVQAPAGYLKTEAGNLIHAEKAGRNDPCPCGSGKKYKKCCGQ